MELNNKEKKVQQVLTEVNFDVDTDFLWKEVSRELDKKKKRRFLWFIPFVLMTGVALSYVFSNYYISANDSISEPSSNNNTAQNTEASQLANTNTNNTLENKSKNSIEEKAETSSSSSSTQRANNKNSTLYNKQNLSAHLSKSLSNGASNIKNNTSLLANTKFSNTGLTNTGFTNNKLATGSISSNTLVDKNETQILNFSELQKIEWASLLFARDKKTIGKEYFQNIEVSDLSKHRFFLTLGGGVVKNIVTKNTFGNEFPSEYLDRQIELPGINSSILFGFQSKKNWRFFAGLDYAQLVSQYKYLETEFISGTLPIDNQANIDQGYQTQITEGELNISTQINNDLTWHKYHNLYNLQLGVSKNILSNSKWLIAPELSLMQNIYSAHSGYFFTEEAPNFTRFTKEDESPYRKNTGLTTQLALNLGCQMRGFEFSINTAWRNPLKTITQGTNFYQTKNSQLSIQARINYILNWENN